MNTPPPLAQPKSSGSGCLKAIGIGCLVVIIAIGGLVYGGYRFITRQFEQYEREGYKTVRGQVIEVTETVTEPTIFSGQIVKIKKGSERGIALLCQTAEIDGKIVGNVHFVGQMLTIHKGAELMRDLDVSAQVVNQFGTVDGKITGVYQMLNKDTNAIPALK